MKNHKKPKTTEQTFAEAHEARIKLYTERDDAGLCIWDGTPLPKHVLENLDNASTIYKKCKVTMESA